MEIFEKLKALLPTDTLSKFIAGFIGFAVLGTIVLVLIIFIPEVRNQVSKVVPFVSTSSSGSIEEYLAEAGGPSLATSPDINFRAEVDLPEGEKTQYTEGNEIWAAMGDTVLLYWDAPTFDPEHPNNKDKLPWTFTKSTEDNPIGPFFWIGCHAQGSRDFWAGGKMANGQDFLWSGFLDAEGNITQGGHLNPPIAAARSVSESVKNPPGGYPIKVTNKVKSMGGPLTMICHRFDENAVKIGDQVYGNVDTDFAQVRIRVNDERKPPPPPPAPTQADIDGAAESGVFSLGPTNLGATSGGCNISFGWSSAAENLLPDQTTFAVVVSTDKDFGAGFEGFEGANQYLGGGGAEGPSYKFSTESTSYYAGKVTDGTNLLWSWKPTEIFEGDSVPEPYNTQSGDINDIIGIGYQSGPGYSPKDDQTPPPGYKVTGSYHWKVISITEDYGISGWVEGPRFSATCKEPKEADSPSHFSLPAGVPPPGPLALTPQNYPEGLNMDVGFFCSWPDQTSTQVKAATTGAVVGPGKPISECPADSLRVQLLWYPKAPFPHNSEQSYTFQISTDPEFSTFAKWSSTANNFRIYYLNDDVGGDMDPAPGVQDKILPGETYYWRVSFSFLQAKKTTYSWPAQEGPNFTFPSEAGEEPQIDAGAEGSSQTVTSSQSGGESGDGQISDDDGDDEESESRNLYERTRDAIHDLFYR